MKSWFLKRIKNLRDTFFACSELGVRRVAGDGSFCCCVTGFTGTREGVFDNNAVVFVNVAGNQRRMHSQSDR